MITQGKVVKIVDEYSVVVDIGSKHGVGEDMEFVIFEEGETVTDPDTGEELGRMEHPKAKVKPHHIMEELTVMESAETEIRTFDPPPTIPTFSNIFSDIGKREKREVRVRKELPLDELPDKQEMDKTIKVGDLVREYHSEPEPDPYGTRR